MADNRMLGVARRPKTEAIREVESATSTWTRFGSVNEIILRNYCSLTSLVHLFRFPLRLLLISDYSVRIPLLRMDKWGHVGINYHAKSRRVCKTASGSKGQKEARWSC